MNTQEFTYTDANDIDKLNEKLLAYPGLIYNAEIVLATAIESAIDAKFKAEKQEAILFLASPYKTVKEKDADTLVQNEELLKGQFKAEVAELKAKADYNKLKSGFDAIKKVANNVEARIKSKL